DGAHAHALLDVEAARLDDAFLEAPALVARVLEIQVGVVDLAGGEGAEHPPELVRLEVEGGQQGFFSGFEDQKLLLCERAGSAALTLVIWAESISASTMPSSRTRTPRISPQG